MNNIYNLERLLRANFETPREFPKNSVLLASFPKSGNSWFRFVVSNVVSFVENEGKEVTFQNINCYAPEIRGNRRLEGARKIENLPLFLKTHFAWIKGFDGVKSVVVVRDPFFAVPSYKNYLEKAKNKNFRGDDMDFYRHWRYGFNAWADFMMSWSDKAHVVVRYEDLMENPLGCFKEMFYKIGYEIEPKALEFAIERSTREKMKKGLRMYGDPNNKNGFDFVRNKGVNKGLEKDLILSQSWLKNDFFTMARKYGYVDH